jgi:hypothetical protein
MVHAGHKAPREKIRAASRHKSGISSHSPSILLDSRRLSPWPSDG